MALEKLTENQFYNELADDTEEKTFQELVYPNFISRNNILNATNLPLLSIQNPAMVNYDGILGTDQAAMFQDDAGLPPIDTSFGVANEPDVEDEEEEQRKVSGLETLLGFTIPGFNVLKNFLPKGRNYEQFSPQGTIRDGIYSIYGVNTPVGMANDFYDPMTGMNRFDRAAQRFRETGSLLDLFKSSRTGAEFFRKKRDLEARQAAAARGAAKQAAIAASQQVDTGGGEGSRPGGFGQGAGDFSPSEATATEGSF